MKKFFNILILIGFSFSSIAQVNDAKSLLESEIYNLLEQEGILLTPMQKIQEKFNNGGPLKWKNANQRVKAIEKDNRLRQYLQSFFILPNFCIDRNISNELVFRNKKIGKLGSYFIRNNNLSRLQNEPESDLPVLESGTQVSVPNPLSNSSNYVLNFTSSKLFTLANKGNVSTNINALFNAKLNQSLRIDNNAKQQISIAAGIFENQLGVLFKKVVNKSLQPQEFPIIYELWLAHKNEKIKNGDKVLSSFEGVAYYSGVGVANDNEIAFDATVNSSGKYPFLSYGLEAASKWVSSQSLTRQSNIYNIYMFAQPALTDIPTPDQILANWKAMTDFRSNIKVSNKLVSVDIPQVVQVKFGPIPSTEILPLVELDKDYSLKRATGTKFIGDINIVKDPKRIKVDDETGYFYTFDVEVIRDENIIAGGQNFPSIITTEIPIRIFINNPIGEKYLDKVFDNIQLTTDTYPTPFFTEVNGNQLKPETEESTNNTIYRAKISFKCPEGIIIGTSLRPLKIVDIIGFSADENLALKALFTNGKIQAIGNNNFEIKFTLQKGKEYFGKDFQNYDLSLILDFGVGNKNYVRRLPLNLEPPAQKAENIMTQAQNVLVHDNEELLTLLNPEVLLKNGKKCSELKSEFMKNGELDIISFVEELKKQTNLTITEKNEYSINSIYLIKVN